MNTYNKECDKFSNAILNYEWLNVAERAELENHIRICGECRNDFSVINEVDMAKLLQSQTYNPAKITENIMRDINRKSLPKNHLLFIFLTVAVFTEILVINIKSENLLADFTPVMYLYEAFLSFFSFLISGLSFSINSIFSEFFYTSGGQGEQDMLTILTALIFIATVFIVTIPKFKIKQQGKV